MFSFWYHYPFTDGAEPFHFRSNHAQPGTLTFVRTFQLDVQCDLNVGLYLVLFPSCFCAFEGALHATSCDPLAPETRGGALARGQGHSPVRHSGGRKTERERGGA